MAVATITNVLNQRGITISNLTSTSRILTIQNPDNRYLRIQYLVGENLIESYDITTSAEQSYTFIFDADAIDDILSDITDTSYSGTGVWRLKSYTDSGRTTQEGANQDYTSFVSIYNVAGISPTFSTASIENIDRNITVTDKYANELVTSSTATLVGNSDVNLIVGVSKIGVTVDVLDKAGANVYASMVDYNMTVYASKGTERSFWVTEPYSAVADVELISDLYNVEYIGGTLSVIRLNARDSRGLYTQITIEPDLVLDYASVVLDSVVLTRDNNTDELTKLAISGSFWKKYFSSGTSVNPGHGVLNTLTVEYRYKETTEAWGAQAWTSITPDTTDGVITYDEYINGDLGASGFDENISFDVEVRAYDKLSCVIVESVLDGGIPLIHYYRSSGSQGICVNGVYDTDEGGSLQVESKNIQPSLVPTGSIFPTVVYSAPAGFLLCDGSSVSRTTYADLFELLILEFGSGTIDCAGGMPQVPYIVNINSHGLSVNDVVFFDAFGVGSEYFVISEDFGTNSFKISTTLGGSSLKSGFNSSTNVVGSTYPFGVADTSNFNLPNMKGKVPLGYNSSDSTFDRISKSGGAKTHALTTAELATHTHTQNSHTHTLPATLMIGSQSSSGLNTGVAAGGAYYKVGQLNDSSPGGTLGSTTATNQNTGSGTAHNNLQPYLVLNYIIKY